MLNKLTKIGEDSWRSFWVVGLFRIIKNRFVSASSEFDFVFEDGNNLSSTIGDALMEMLTENMKDLIINSGWEWNPVHERGNCCES